MTRPKFKVGQTVTYKNDRRLRRVITERYWDKSYPGWRYRFKKFGLRADLAACWAVIESELRSVAQSRG